MPLSLWDNSTAAERSRQARSPICVLLDKDPLADIHNTRSIEAVVLNGKLLPRVALDAMLAEAQVLASRPDAGESVKRN